MQPTRWLATNLALHPHGGKPPAGLADSPTENPAQHVMLFANPSVIAPRGPGPQRGLSTWHPTAVHSGSAASLPRASC